MHSFPFQIVLLLTVAFSQIFGGVSCCCLSRLIVASLQSAQAPDSLAGGQSDADTETNPETNAPRCPRCAASKACKQSSKESDTDSAESKADSITGDRECNCSKVYLKALAQDELQTPRVYCQFLNPPVALVTSLRRGLECVYRRHEIPIRLGGLSWQAVACIWRN